METKAQVVTEIRLKSGSGIGRIWQWRSQWRWAHPDGEGIAISFEAAEAALEALEEDKLAARRNARLVAAAPELLEALEYYVRQHETHLGGIPEHNPNDGKVWGRTLALAKAAIAKAKGGQS